MKKIICILLFLIPLFNSCVKRDWTNPFDSACPKEMWTPTNFTAVQEGSTVKLTWSQPIDNISGFKILKGIDGAAGTSLQDQTKGTTQITDNSLTGGKVHLYSLTAFAGNNTSNTVTAQVTPVMMAGITTTAMSSIAGTTATCGGTITSDGGAAITARGVCWGTTQTPTIAGSKTSDGTGSGTFTSAITGLSPGTTYYARAYAINSVGTAYGTQVNFTTSIALPVLATTVLSSITATTATSGGTITTDGGSTITARGVCWGTTSAPVITGSKTTDGTGMGTFTSSISGLTAGTTYYVRAYATNSAGTAYGNELTLTTTASLATLTTTAIGSVASTTATSGGNITNSGGATITARGVCWATTQTPTIAGSKSTDGTGTGIFTSSITGLTPGATYYVRAYAINSAGTAYGNELTLTASATMPVVATTAMSAITSTSASSGGTITADGGAAIIARGVCWGTSTGPTITGSKTTEGTGTGTFTSNLTGLTAGVTYFVRAYATNSTGTSYGNEITFSSTAVIPTLTTTAISALTGSTAASGGNITSNGGSAVTARGVCYGTASGPTIAGSKTTDGTGSGVFTSAISGLTPGTTYYARAYAINSAGTGYGTELSFKTILADPQFNSTKSYGSVTDIDGNVYKTIVIGTQTWMAENLKTTTYKDGTPIALVTDNTAWAKLTTGGYSWYNNDATSNKSIYGALYNWYTVGTAKLCPTGWRVPTDAEWTTLATYLGGTSLAGGKLKELGTSHWLSPNTGATNETGYTALSGGGRSATDGTFNFMGNDGNWWSSMEYSSTIAYNMSLYSGSSNEYVLTNPKTYGYSVRCIAEPLSLPTLTTNSISGINYNSATCGGVISSDGGTAITSRGICWSTAPSPTIANSKTTDGTGTGSYVSLVTGLTASTTYYVRSYATNSAGTAYGTQVSFTTVALGAKTVTAGQLSAVLTSTELSSLTKLTLTGTLDARDFKIMRDNMPLLAEIDLSGISIAAYNGTAGTHPTSTSYAANAIPAYAFCRQDASNTLYGKTSLVSIVLPSNITSIDERAFTSCTGLTSFTIPASVLTLGPSAFFACNNLISLNIPVLVNTIGSQAFQSSNISVTVDANNQYFSGLDGLLYNKLKTTLYYCPATKTGTYTVPSSVTIIGTYAFGSCNKLTTINLPSSLNVIDLFLLHFVLH